MNAATVLYLAGLAIFAVVLWNQHDAWATATGFVLTTSLNTVASVMNVLDDPGWFENMILFVNGTGWLVVTLGITHALIERRRAMAANRALIAGL